MAMAEGIRMKNPIMLKNTTAKRLKINVGMTGSHKMKMAIASSFVVQSFV